MRHHAYTTDRELVGAYAYGYSAQYPSLVKLCRVRTNLNCLDALKTDDPNIVEAIFTTKTKNDNLSRMMIADTACELGRAKILDHVVSTYTGEIQIPTKYMIARGRENGHHDVVDPYATKR